MEHELVNENFQDILFALDELEMEVRTDDGYFLVGLLLGQEVRGVLDEGEHSDDGGVVGEDGLFVGL